MSSQDEPLKTFGHSPSPQSKLSSVSQSSSSPEIKKKLHRICKYQIYSLYRIQINILTHNEPKRRKKSILEGQCTVCLKSKKSSKLQCSDQ